MHPRLAFVLLLAMVLARSAAAQDADSAAQPYRKWDVSGTWALRFGCSSECDPVVGAASWTADAGYYWTPHVKTSVGVATAPSETALGYTDVRADRYVFEYGRAKPAALSAGIAYQFFENAFVHPYVTAGARVAWVSSVTETALTARPYTTTTVVGPLRAEPRPVIGGGFKSYFDNGRVFMQSELGLTLGSSRKTHPVLRIGAGVDF